MKEREEGGVEEVRREERANAVGALWSMIARKMTVDNELGFEESG